MVEDKVKVEQQEKVLEKCVEEEKEDAKPKM
jgi:hypothetical protein